MFVCFTWNRSLMSNSFACVIASINIFIFTLLVGALYYTYDNVLHRLIISYVNDYRALGNIMSIPLAIVFDILNCCIIQALSAASFVKRF